MQDLTSQGHRAVEDLARREDVSTDAVMTLLSALQRGGGTQAQFNHPDLGGMGQWSRGGMTMVGDMFNQTLKAKVDRLCSELAKMIGDEALFARAATTRNDGDDGDASSSGRGSVQGRWPAALGRPSSTGSQNDMHYAVFPDTRRLAIERDGKVTVYDTGDHRIGGASQQQSGDQSLSFTSQHGAIRLADLPVVEDHAADAQPQPEPDAEPAKPSPAPAPAAPPRAHADVGDDVFGKIEQLAELHRKGVLTDDEFNAKKADLLGRI